MIEFSAHAKLMITERGIDEAWVWRAINEPQRRLLEADGNIHYVKTIRQRGGRILRPVSRAAKVSATRTMRAESGMLGPFKRPG